MIEGLKPYAEYKESGLPWIGRVPIDWRIERTKWIFRSRKELNVGRRNTNVLSLTLRGVVNNDPDSPEGMVPKDYATYQLFRKHDLVFKLIDLENIRTSRVGLVHEDGIMSSAYVRLAPSKSVNIRFFYFQFFDLYTRAIFNALGAGVRSTLGATDLGELKIAIPPPDEQAAIVRFLDHANRKIDGFIRAKRKLIGLLNEQKQAIIHRAITRGLDPEVPLKPSGIPWLGDIPKHWDVLRAKYVFREMDERSKTGNEEQLSVSHITGVTPRSQKNITMFKAESYVGHKICRPGDLAVNTMWAWMAALGVSKHEGIISPAYAVYRQRKPERLLSDFADHLLRIAPYKLNYLSRSTGLRPSRLRLYPDAFFRIPIVIPPKDEQQQIVDSISVATAALTTAIARTEREIALMQEYRTRLTADLVTGKLDVREAAAHLPAPPADAVTESPTDEPLEDIETEDAEA
jgi:type I restriction enzyme S subunit